MLACQTQWRVGFSGVTGLDYNAMFSVAGALEVKVDAKVLQGIMVLEAVTIARWNKNQDKE